MDHPEPIDLTPDAPRASGDGFVAEWNFEDCDVAPPFGAAFYTLSPGGTSRLDHHEVREVWLVTGGYGWLTCASHRRRIGPGTVVMFAPWQEHQVESDDGALLTLVSLWWSES